MTYPGSRGSLLTRSTDVPDRDECEEPALQAEKSVNRGMARLRNRVVLFIVCNLKKIESILLRRMREKEPRLDLVSRRAAAHF